MTRDEYNLLFHKLNLNLVAFKMLFQCDKEVLALVNHAIEAEREACAKLCEGEGLYITADSIRARTMAFDSGALTSDPGPLRQRGTK